MKDPVPNPSILIQPSTGISRTESMPNITKKSKRRRLSDGSISGEIEELKSMVTTLMETQTARLDSFENLIKEASIESTNSNIEMQKSMGFLSDKLLSMESMITGINNERQLLADNVGILQEKIDVVERNSIKTCVEIRNVPKMQKEPRGHLVTMVENIAKNLDLLINRADIRDIFRLPSKADNKASTLIVEFQNTFIKSDFLYAAKKYNKSRPGQQLSSKHLGFSEINTPIYISERLTAKTRRLHFLARDIAKTEMYAHCWISNGKVYLRKREGAPYIQVRNELQLEDLKTKFKPN